MGQELNLGTLSQEATKVNTTPTWSSNTMLLLYLARTLAKAVYKGNIK